MASLLGVGAVWCQPAASQGQELVHWPLGPKWLQEAGVCVARDAPSGCGGVWPVMHSVAVSIGSQWQYEKWSGRGSPVMFG